jgi:myo-inositol-1(or 4)-monophosphatase
MYSKISPSIIKAGKILKDNLKKEKHVRFKGKQQYLTDFDIQLDKLLVASIKKHFPTHSINAEETGFYKGSSEYTWYIDPLSNTRNFIHGLPGFAVAVGVAKNDMPIYGAVYDPMLDELFTGEEGKGAFCNSKNITVSKISVLEHAFINADWQKRKTQKEIDEGVKIFTSIARTCTVRAVGSVALMMAYTAAGRLDGMVNNYSDIHAVVPGMAILKAAGGNVKDLKGNTWTLESTSTFATNGYIDKKILKELSWYS